jgi:hypothetical protein
MASTIDYRGLLAELVPSRAVGPGIHGHLPVGHLDNLSLLPRAFMRADASFSQTPGNNYYPKRGHSVRPKSLVLKIRADEALAMYKRGDIEKVDLCGIEFLRLLKKLRVGFPPGCGGLNERDLVP